MSNDEIKFTDLEDTVVRNKSDAEQSDTAESVSEPERSWPEYTIPDWFLVHNVRTFAEVKVCQLPFPIFFAPVEEGEDYRSGHGEDISDIDIEGPVDLLLLEYETTEASFSELRDVTAAALVPGRKGKLSTSCIGALVQGPPDNFSPFIQGMLQLVAKDLQASLVSVTRDDLVDLGSEFDRQDKARVRRDTEAEIASEPGSNGDALTGSGDEDEEECNRCLSQLGSRYFAPGPRVRSAFDAILDSHLVKSNATESMQGSPSTPSGPVIIHIHDCLKIMHSPSWRGALSRLSEAVRDRRALGQPIALVGSIVTRTPGNRCCNGCMTNPRSFDANLPRVEEELKISSHLESSTVNLYSNYVFGKGTFGAPDMGFVRGAANTRQLKRRLRDQIPHLFTPEVLQLLEPSTEPRTRGFDDEDYMMGEGYWDKGDISRAVAQMAGRALGKSHIDLDDVKAVLLRLDMMKKKEPVKKKAPKSAATKRREAWDDKIHTARLDATGFEKDLIGNIVNPDDIDCTLDDVVMDPATKDHLRHLIALSISSAPFKPIASSHLIQKQLRLNGTLLYGLPRMGKTHLARTIAKSSSANFISVDAASLQHKWSGESEKAIKAAFTLATKLYPYVLFFDEVDALF